MLEGIAYYDFVNLYAVAVGLSMAYIYVTARSKSERLSFLNFLSDMADWIASLALFLKTKSQKKEESTLARVRYILAQNSVDDEMKGALCTIEKMVKKNLKTISDFEERKKSALCNATKAEYLPILSADSFLYGLLLLFFSAVDIKTCYDLNGRMIIMDIFMLLAIIHCVCFDHFSIHSDNFFRPRLGLHIALFIIVAFFVFSNCNINYSFQEPVHTYYIMFSVPMCFIGFIVYFLISFLVCLFHLIISIFQIIRMPLGKLADNHIELLREYESKLVQQDKQLNDNKLENVEFI